MTKSGGHPACFNSRTPGGVRLGRYSKLSDDRVFQFTHPGRGATHAKSANLVPGRVSIHAPREGCDFYRRQDYEASHPVSIHAPREGCDYTKLSDDRVKRFQFTHPGRGATSVHTLQTSAKRSFNSRTPGGVRPYRTSSLQKKPGVSIHAPREGCDLVPPRFMLSDETFQFTHPGRGATLLSSLVTLLDMQFQFTHPGRGATTCPYTNITDDPEFQFTHPGRGATCRKDDAHRNS